MDRRLHRPGERLAELVPGHEEPLAMLSPGRVERRLLLVGAVEGDPVRLLRARALLRHLLQRIDLAILHLLPRLLARTRLRRLLGGVGHKVTSLVMRCGNPSEPADAPRVPTLPKSCPQIVRRGGASRVRLRAKTVFN